MSIINKMKYLLTGDETKVIANVPKLFEGDRILTEDEFQEVAGAQCSGTDEDKEGE